MVDDPWVPEVADKLVNLDESPEFLQILEKESLRNDSLFFGTYVPSTRQAAAYRDVRRDALSEQVYALPLVGNVELLIFDDARSPIKWNELRQPLAKPDLLKKIFRGYEARASFG